MGVAIYTAENSIANNLSFKHFAEFNNQVALHTSVEGTAPPLLLQALITTGCATEINTHMDDV